MTDPIQTKTPSADPFVVQEQEFRDKVAQIHKDAPAVIAKVEGVVDTIALETVADVKAEALALEPRLKALLARVEDLAHTGMTNNPVFKEAAALVSHVVNIAKSL